MLRGVGKRNNRHTQHSQDKHDCDQADQGTALTTADSAAGWSENSFVFHGLILQLRGLD
jgi:hypothetical protein